MSVADCFGTVAGTVEKTVSGLFRDCQTVRYLWKKRNQRRMEVCGGAVGLTRGNQ